jgi:hypothetical protein
MGKLGRRQPALVFDLEERQLRLEGGRRRFAVAQP